MIMQNVTDSFYEIGNQFRIVHQFINNHKFLGQ